MDISWDVTRAVFFIFLAKFLISSQNFCVIYHIHATYRYYYGTFKVLYLVKKYLLDSLLNHWMYSWCLLILTLKYLI